VEQAVEIHTPVLLAEVLAALAIRADGVYLDATYGRGGHAGAILRVLGDDGRLLCLDRDSAAIAEARSRFAADARVGVFHAPFSALEDCADRVTPGLEFDGMLFDLGVSSPQLDDAERGFSFMKDGPLDMRMDAGARGAAGAGAGAGGRAGAPARAGATAADLVNNASQSELARIFRDYGEERFAQRIARAIVADREKQPFERTLQLAEMIARVAPSRERHKHPATRVFQALRIAVNGELAELELALEAALRRLAPGGRLAVISFHSLEDRMVKHFMRRHSLADPMYAGLPHIPPQAQPKLRLVGKAIAPQEAEMSANPRARSAHLRVAERLDPRAAA
jgi:16S rRNA (cytosine1402-N4)-methyltransferase